MQLWCKGLTSKEEDCGAGVLRSARVTKKEATQSEYETKLDALDPEWSKNMGLLSNNKYYNFSNTMVSDRGLLSNQSIIYLLLFLIRNRVTTKCFRDNPKSM